MRCCTQRRVDEGRTESTREIGDRSDSRRDAYCVGENTVQCSRTFVRCFTQRRVDERRTESTREIDNRSDSGRDAHCVGESTMKCPQHVDESYVKILQNRKPPHPHRILHEKPWRHFPRAHVRLIIIYTQKRVEISPLVEMAFRGLRHH